MGTRASRSHWPRSRSSAPARSEVCLPRFRTVFAVAAAMAILGPAPAWAASACGKSDYSYAGLQGVQKSHGVRATLTALAAPRVVAGHVAAWVGVGWAGGGPGGQDEWMQVGMDAEQDYSTPRLYYEIVKPGAPYRYVELGEASPGQSHRLA